MDFFAPHSNHSDHRASFMWAHGGPSKIEDHQITDTWQRLEGEMNKIRSRTMRQKRENFRSIQFALTVILNLIISVHVQLPWSGWSLPVVHADVENFVIRFSFYLGSWFPSLGLSKQILPVPDQDSSPNSLKTEQRQKVEWPLASTENKVALCDFNQDSIYQSERFIHNNCQEKKNLTDQQQYIQDYGENEKG